ncbi:predicted protein [Histoplasma mississippiense (nom. inval.)]|uniref:predicted protein n=1 Tax=Ajellomyces capsulatus (strain NAm1 / WU24) TaxID=2059318 RepID=UPI000157D33E|nr:predicted protein [Histoplasma mississippiense (nom. inval.)]XP_001536264.1 predicted protein [Histoplasma mississippiense (nom. inval.)]EDN04931.1 predicted protein [Histoplasma mississippiense (nom. inval.)]EDN06529.1 predicted protein [Histoplasma mississippiense (nom. inval.)]
MGWLAAAEGKGRGSSTATGPLRARGGGSGSTHGRPIRDGENRTGARRTTHYV